METRQRRREDVELTQFRGEDEEDWRAELSSRQTVVEPLVGGHDGRGGAFRMRNDGSMAWWDREAPPVHHDWEADESLGSALTPGMKKCAWVSGVLLVLCLTVAAFKVGEMLKANEDDTLQEELRKQVRALTEDAIFPDVLSSFSPVVELDLSFGPRRSLYKAEPMLAAEVEMRPDVQYSLRSRVPMAAVHADMYYSLVLVDADAPSAEQPTDRCWLHWEVVDIPGSNVSAGREVLSWTSPKPPAGDKGHRYVLILMQQEQEMLASGTEAVAGCGAKQSTRSKFDVRRFIKTCGLRPIGLTYFLGSMPAPIT